MSDQQRGGVPVVNLTNFFNRELLMYSLGDIKFKKPVALKKVAYITLFLIVWTVPLVLIFGVPTGPIRAIIYFVIPIVLGNVASKPVFGGKGLIDFVKTLFNFAQEPNGWLDFKNSKDLDNEVLYIESEVWISRRREIAKLESILEKGTK